ncbi:hypothetical protein Q8F55_009171 [Vanrija albida]|uniref:NAD-dependent epimerase/dehydratase domain-containing protein n=1 Tax=Vanrija albida TaxID=181172 RepID=A0ABR3PSW7_9TREE
MAGPTYDFQLPAHVQTVLLTGANGFVGREVTKLLLELYPSLRVITTDIVEPPRYVDDEKRLRVVQADLGKPDELAKLFEGEKIGGVFALHGIMSGGSEANFELGWAVNVDSHVALLKAVRKHNDEIFGKPDGSNPRIVHVFISSLAVYGGPKAGPKDHVIPSDTPLIAGTSYGVQKQIGELYAYDYGRKGYLDTRSLRLPTVAIRTGAPSTAASSFFSGLIREPLQGLEAICPVASGPDDPMLDEIPHYLSRAKTVFRNIVWGMAMPESNFKYGHRSINIPGITITPRQIIAALKEHGGDEALKLIKYEKDPAVINICLTWAGSYDNSEALASGFEVDDAKTGFADAVGDFKQALQEESK